MFYFQFDTNMVPIPWTTNMVPIPWLHQGKKYIKKLCGNKCHSDS